MATNNEKSDEKKASAEKPVEVKAKTTRKTSSTAKKSGTTAKKAASTAKKTTTTAKKTTAVKAKAVKAKKDEPILKEAQNSLKEAQETLKSGNFDRGALILSVGLIFMGFLLLAGRLLHIPFGVFIWPFIFIVPGVLIFMSALSTESSSGEGLSILGGILTTLGCIFLAQSTLNLWASWAYVWALIAPTSIGVSQMIYGMRKDRDAIVQSGRRLATIGLTIFAVGFVFFEVILGISGFGLARFGLPVFPMILIFLGVFVLVTSFLKNRK
jgi:hypothetical protein